MNTRTVLLVITLLLLATGAMHAQYFDGPESVMYDELNGRYLITSPLTGNITQITDEGDTSFFFTLGRTLGMTIVDSNLYVCDRSGLVMFDLTTDEWIRTIRPAGSVELNDVTADTSGYLYITDSSAGRIYRVRMIDYSVSTLVSGLQIPNGILFDARNNRVLFVQFISHAPIKQISLPDLTITTILQTTYANFDGLAMDGNGNVYVSAWGTNTIYRYDNAFTQPAERVSWGHSGPADIFYNQRDNILAVPNYYTDLVEFLPITPAGLEEDPARVPRAFSLSQNYPNPFNPMTTIRYEIAEPSKVELRIYDLRGREIRTLVDERQPAGAKAVAWDGRDNAGRPVGSGVYIYRIRTESSGAGGTENHAAGLEQQSRKMLLVR